MPSLPEPGTEWAGFHIEGQIGEGGFGRVYTAWDPSLQRRVAIKVLLGPREPDGRIDDTVRERFLRESRTAAGLDHPRIVPIHLADEHDGVPYIVMRHVAGGDLREEIRQSPLTLDRTISVISQVASALDRAHRGGLVHRDVKPANILCSEDTGDVYLADFGITRFMAESTDEGLTLTGHAPPASPHYASPEQLRGEPVGPTADVYSLGCTLFECLTGRVPFTGGTSIEVAHHQLQSDPPRISEIRPDLPVALDGIIARAMAKDPDQRFPTGAAMAEALATVGDPRLPSSAVFPDATEVDPAPIRPGRSVFDDATEVEAAGVVPGAATVVAAPAAEVTAPVVAASDATGVYPAVPLDVRRPDGTVDGAYYDVWEDDTPRSRTPLVVGLAVTLAALLVGGLVWRAVNTGADLRVPADETTTTTEAVASGPTVADLQALLPTSLTSCGPPAEQPTDEPSRVVLQCPLASEPEFVSFELYADLATRDSRFDDLVAFAGLPTQGTDCALAQSGVHRYAGVEQSGRLSCRIADGVTDLVWTDDATPVLALSAGKGRYRDDYTFFSELVGRTDDGFPLPAETELLARIPDEYTLDCRRDVDLTVDARGEVAVACEPPNEEATVISWVRFGSPDVMRNWIESRQGGLSNTFATADDACTSKGFGKVEEGIDDDDDDDDDAAEPDAGFGEYELDDTAGQILCFINASRQNVLFWTRRGELLGSIAVSSTEGRSMKDLLKWWEQDGHRP